MKVLAVDPGKQSGWALWVNNEFLSGSKPCLEALDSAWRLCLDQVKPDLIVCESFIVTAQTLKKTRGENWSLESIGALRWMCRRAGVEFALQSPVDAKSFVSNDRLREVGWYSTDDHARDAARHLLLALARHDPPAFKRLILAPGMV